MFNFYVQKNILFIKINLIYIYFLLKSIDIISMNFINKENNNNLNLTYFSFYITYVFLMTTATITFIEAMRTNIPEIRNILN